MVMTGAHEAEVVHDEREEALVIGVTVRVVIDDERTEARARKALLQVTLRRSSEVDSDVDEVLLHLSKMVVRQHRNGDRHETTSSPAARPDKNPRKRCC